MILGQPARIDVLPQPQHVVIGQPDAAVRLDHTPRLYSNVSRAMRKRLTKVLRVAGIAVKIVTKAEDAQISLILDPKSSIVSEGYTLHASTNHNRIDIRATSETGLFYAIQTALQLLALQPDGTWQCAAVNIHDAPRYPYRGLHLDVSRHFRSVAFIKKQIDAMARYKLNRLHWHLTDSPGWRLAIKRYPQLTEQVAYRPYPNYVAWWKEGQRFCTASDSAAQGGYYTQAEVRDLVRYAAERHITIVPEIEMPGHSDEVNVVFPKLSCWQVGGLNRELCIGREETFTFLENVLREVITLFPSEYIHVGGDEARQKAWKACTHCQARKQAEGLKDEYELQSYLITRIERFLNKHGRKLIGWDEILDGQVSPTASIMSWRGERGGIRAAQTKHYAVMTPEPYCYLDHYQDAPLTQPLAISGYTPLSKVYAYNPTPSALTTEQQQYILGVQGNTWSEYIVTDEHWEYMAYPRLLALAEVAWTDTTRKAWPHFRTLALRETDYLRSHGYTPFDLRKEIGQRPEAITPRKHLAFGCPVSYLTPYSKQWPAGGDTALTNGLAGGWSYTDGSWQGFENGHMAAIVDLGDLRQITCITTEWMQLINKRLYLPLTVVYSTSTDGQTYIPLYHFVTHADDNNMHLNLTPLIWQGATQARYIKIEAENTLHPSAWLAIDEIRVE
ncbi:MAG: family 20 glycosylhydrolase [Bacteroidales bacterium]|nr:family 20 glycosylhydrolase [Bacteroidales bacterium]